MQNYDEWKNTVQSANERYKGLAETYGYDPTRIVYDPVRDVAMPQDYGAGDGSNGVPVSGGAPRVPNPRAAEWLKNNPFPN